MRIHRHTFAWYRHRVRRKPSVCWPQSAPRRQRQPVAVEIVSHMDFNQEGGFNTGDFAASGPAVEQGLICESGTVEDTRLILAGFQSPTGQHPDPGPQDVHMRRRQRRDLHQDPGAPQPQYPDGDVQLGRPRRDWRLLGSARQRRWHDRRRRLRASDRKLQQLRRFPDRLAHAPGRVWPHRGTMRQAPVAQWIERSRPKAGVGGSNPSGGASFNASSCDVDGLDSRHDRVDQGHEPADVLARPRTRGLRAHGHRVGGLHASRADPRSRRLRPCRAAATRSRTWAISTRSKRSGAPRGAPPPVHQAGIRAWRRRAIDLGTHRVDRIVVWLHPRPRRRGDGRRHRTVVRAGRDRGRADGRRPRLVCGRIRHRDA